MRAKSTPAPEVVLRLAELYHRNGYVRKCDPELRARLKQRFHRGDEVRLVADTRKELIEIRRLLRTAGFKPGRPFAKAKQYRLPVYGRSEVVRFLTLIGEAGEPRITARTPQHAPVPQCR